MAVLVSFLCVKKQKKERKSSFTIVRAFLKFLITWWGSVTFFDWACCTGITTQSFSSFSFRHHRVLSGIQSSEQSWMYMRTPSQTVSDGDPGPPQSVILSQTLDFLGYSPSLEPDWAWVLLVWLMSGTKLKTPFRADPRPNNRKALKTFTAAFLSAQESHKGPTTRAKYSKAEEWECRAFTGKMIWHRKKGRRFKYSRKWAGETVTHYWERGREGAQREKTQT